MNCLMILSVLNLGNDFWQNSLILSTGHSVDGIGYCNIAKKKLDDGWPERAEEHVTLVLLEGVQKRCVVS